MRCAMCHEEIPSGTQGYVLRIELHAGADEISVSNDDLTKDTEAELKQLIEKLARLDDAEADEETDRIFERYEFRLCAHCRSIIHDTLKKNR